MCAFLYFYIFYYPIKYRKLAYGTNAHCLLVYCGVIYTRVKAVPFTSIQYTSVFSTPLERLFGVTSLFVYAAGGRVYIPGLAPQDARELQALLTPGRPHSAAQEGGAGDV
nr:PH domain-containing protein [Anaerotruncus colihominis]